MAGRGVPGGDARNRDTRPVGGPFAPPTRAGGRDARATFQGRPAAAPVTPRDRTPPAARRRPACLTEASTAALVLGALALSGLLWAAILAVL